MVYRGKEKATVAISLTDSQKDNFIPSYTSLDQIRGNVTLTAPADTPIDQVYITFEGISKTYVEKIASSSPTNGRTEAFQCFLRLVQPMEDVSFPESGIAEAGKTYTFPFTFAVPEKLLPQACNHNPENDVVHHTHLQPPPTLGDPLTAVHGRSMMDDMAPDMSIVSYAIRARITSGRGSNGKHVIIAENSKKVRVVPAIPEHPPLAVSGGKVDDYKLRKEKPIKKGTFKGRLGTLIMETSQPRSLRLPPPQAENPCRVTTMATVNLRFDPSCPGAQAPRLGTIVTKLKVATFFASTPMREIPRRSTDFQYSSTRGIYVETVPLSSRCLASVEWVPHNAPDITIKPRQNSVMSTVSSNEFNTPSPSSAFKEGQIYYTAHVLVPITLPEKSDGSHNNKIFVPTFHSCLVSRIYALDFFLSCHTPGASVTDPSMHLKIPIQVSAEANADARPSISEGEAQAIARREGREAADFLWHPRSVAPPSPEYTERAPIATFAPPSPDYAEVPPPTPPSAADMLRREGHQSPEYDAGHWDTRAPQVNRGMDTLDGLAPPDYSVHTSGRPNVS
ncbi:MAG: hypothetical protein Q9220_002570 [cf. Caloplaca sp. 1 TL-2023]